MKVTMHGKTLVAFVLGFTLAGGAARAAVPFSKPAVSIRDDGVARGLASTLDCGAGMTCSVAGGVASMSATSGGAAIPAACGPAECLTSDGSALVCQALPPPTDPRFDIATARRVVWHAPANATVAMLGGFSNSGVGTRVVEAGHDWVRLVSGTSAPRNVAVQLASTGLLVQRPVFHALLRASANRTWVFMGDYFGGLHFTELPSSSEAIHSRHFVGAVWDVATGWMCCSGIAKEYSCAPMPAPWNDINAVTIDWSVIAAPRCVVNGVGLTRASLVPSDSSLVLGLYVGSWNLGTDVPPSQLDVSRIALEVQ